MRQLLIATLCERRPNFRASWYRISRRGHATFTLAAIGLLSVGVSGCQAPLPTVTAQVADTMAAESRPLDATPVVASAAPISLHSKEQPTLEPIALDALFTRAKSLVAQQTGADLDQIEFQLSSDSSISEEVAHETRRLIDSQFTHPAFADHFLDAVMAGQAGTYAALYAGRRSQVMISKSLLDSYRRTLGHDRELQESALLALLIHELVHAADDQQFQIHDNRTLNFRASFAQSAAFEGHAQWVTRRICRKHDCLHGLQALDNFMFSRSSSSNPLTQTVQAVSRNVLEYSYIEGERFLDALARRPEGDKLIAQLLTEPPQDPVQILDPASYPNHAREQRNQRLLNAAASINHPWLDEPWTLVETSPLKGVNLRADPSKREAAIDGFTRLITSMIALQLYEQSRPDQQPVEITLLSTDADETAQLFGETLHQNSQLPDTTFAKQELTFYANDTNTSWPLTFFWRDEQGQNHARYHTLVAVSGSLVIQLAAYADDTATLADFATKTLAKLRSQAPA